MDIELWLLSASVLTPMVFPYDYTMWIPILALAVDLYLHYLKKKTLTSLSTIVIIGCVRSLSFYFQQIDCSGLVETFDFGLQSTVVVATTIFHTTVGGGHMIPAGVYILMLAESQITGMMYFNCS